jgi:hypothetical protein
MRERNKKRIEKTSYHAEIEEYKMGLTDDTYETGEMHKEFSSENLKGRNKAWMAGAIKMNSKETE